MDSQYSGTGANFIVSFHLPSGSAFLCDNDGNMFPWNKWKELILTYIISFIKLVTSFQFIKAYIYKSGRSSTVHLEISLQLQ